MIAQEPGEHPWGNTLRVRAEILVTGGRTIDGFLHLQPLASIHSGPETPEDALNRHESFVPVTSDNRTLFIAKNQILAVTVRTPLPTNDVDRVEAARTLGMQLELSDGTGFVGAVTTELPPDRARVLDFLNHADGFFCLVDQDAMRFVNRVHVRLVTPLD
ncbi:MAG TPA: hypothetical protein VFU23_15490 [Gemmatimonadales bacterium]|nr:hypothetical protein [Gemmatimonadales bacterium]